MTDTIKTWTAEEIEAIFAEEYTAADAANREATSGPFNPYGDAYESLVWSGTIREAWRTEQWKALADAINADREDEGEGPLDWDADWDVHGDMIEAKALELAETTVGAGRPLVVSFSDGAFPYVFCEYADEDAVRRAVAMHYDWSDSESEAR